MKHFMIVTLLFTLGACSGGDKGPQPEPVADHEMWVCFERYTWNGLFYTWDCPDGGWYVASNQPVFTSYEDCHVAVHIEQQNDPDIWDNHDEAKKVLLRSLGSAYFLACYEVR